MVRNSNGYQNNPGSEYDPTIVFIRGFIVYQYIEHKCGEW